MSKHKRGYGYIPDLPDHRDFAFTVSKPIELPPSVDLRPNMPSVYDQGNLGSCTANAIGAALQFERMRHGLPNADKQIPSRLFIYYRERVIEHTVKSDCGAMIRDGMKVVAKDGACFEDVWKYDISKFAHKPSNKAYAEAKKDKVLAYARIDQNERSMKTCLATGTPFTLGFTCYDGFESDEVAKTGILNMPEAKERVTGGHAILVVGYNEADRRFIVRNSWGNDWGMKGYFTVPYDYFLNADLAEDIWQIKLI